MLYYSMSFVSLDEDVAGNLSHCCCNVFDDLVVVNEGDDSFYLECRVKGQNSNTMSFQKLLSLSFQS